VVSNRREQRIPVYLGERYLPGASDAQVAAAASRLRAAATNLAEAGSSVRLISTTFVPSEEWVFDVFEAEATKDVALVYARARQTVERIADAVYMPAGRTERSLHEEGLRRE
jgi:hypothetical protein